MSDIDRASQAGVPLVKGGFADFWTENQRLKLELAAALKDAERYRWLRDTANKADIQTALLSGLQPRFIDDAIDGAIAAEQPPPHA